MKYQHTPSFFPRSILSLLTKNTTPLCPSNQSYPNTPVSHHPPQEAAAIACVIEPWPVRASSSLRQCRIYHPPLGVFQNPPLLAPHNATLSLPLPLAAVYHQTPTSQPLARSINPIRTMKRPRTKVSHDHNQKSRPDCFYLYRRIASLRPCPSEALRLEFGAPCLIFLPLCGSRESFALPLGPCLAADIVMLILILRPSKVR